MIIENRMDLFHGCTESMIDKVEELKDILVKSNDIHTVLSCLSAMSAYARWDLTTTLQMMDDIEGLEDIVADSIMSNLESSDKYLKLIKG